MSLASFTLAAMKLLPPACLWCALWCSKRGEAEAEHQNSQQRSDNGTHTCPAAFNQGMPSPSATCHHSGLTTTTARYDHTQTRHRINTAANCCTHAHTPHHPSPQNKNTPESGWFAIIIRLCASLIRSSAAVSRNPSIKAASRRFISGWKPPL